MENKSFFLFFVKIKPHEEFKHYLYSCYISYDRKQVSCISIGNVSYPFLSLNQHLKLTSLLSLL